MYGLVLTVREPSGRILIRLKLSAKVRRRARPRLHELLKRRKSQKLPTLHRTTTTLLRDMTDVDKEPQISFLALGSDQSKKRRRDTVNDESCTQSKRAIKKRRSKVSKAHELEDESLDTEQGLNTALGKLDGRLLADYVAQRTKRFAPDLSMLEMEDQYLPGMSDLRPIIQPRLCRQANTRGRKSFYRFQ